MENEFARVTLNGLAPHEQPQIKSHREKLFKAAYDKLPKIHDDYLPRLDQMKNEVLETPGLEQVLAESCQDCVLGNCVVQHTPPLPKSDAVNLVYDESDQFSFESGATAALAKLSGISLSDSKTPENHPTLPVIKPFRPTHTSPKSGSKLLLKHRLGKSSPSKMSNEVRSLVDRDFQTKVKIYCIKFGSRLNTIPYMDWIKDKRICESFKKRAKHNGFSSATPLQRHIIPAVMNGRSVAVISSPSSGKTISYLWVILQSYFEEDTSIGYRPKDEFTTSIPQYVILCPTYRSASSVLSRINSMITNATSHQTRPRKPKVIVLTTVNLSNIYQAMRFGCDILIATPPAIAKYLEEKCHIFDALTCLILEDADLLLQLHAESVKNVIASYWEAKHHYNTRMGSSSKEMITASQIVLLSNRWTQVVAKFEKEMLHSPFIVFGSFFEAAVYAGVKSTILWTTSDKDSFESIQQLIEHLNSSPYTRQVVFTRDDLQADKLFGALMMTTSKFLTLQLIRDTPEHRYSKISDDFNSSLKTVLIISDSSAEHFDQIVSANHIIHYWIPPLSSPSFHNRFKFMHELLALERRKTLFSDNTDPIDSENFSQPDKPLNTQAMCTIVASHEDRAQLWALLNFCKRLHYKCVVPEDFLAARNLSYTVPWCSLWKVRGSCPLGTVLCSRRHFFNTQTDQPDETLPVDGQIRFQITQVFNPNEFKFRLVSHRNADQQINEWKKFELNNFEDIKQELERVESSMEKVQSVQVGDVYGLEVVEEVIDEDEPRRVTHRVRIDAVLSSEANIVAKDFADKRHEKFFQVRVYHLDYGYKSETRSSLLYPLTQRLAQYPPTVFDGIACGIVPPNGDLDWEESIIQEFKSMVSQSKISHLTAWVKMQVSGTFWLDFLKVRNEMTPGSGVYATTCKPIAELVNCDHAVRPAGREWPDIFSVPQGFIHNNLSEIWGKWALDLQQSAITYAHLDDLTLVYNIGVDISTDKSIILYVSLVSNNNFLIKLEKEARHELSKSRLKPLKGFVKGLICWAECPDIDDGSICRARIEYVRYDTNCVDVFYLDHGDFKSNLSISKCYSISNSHIRRLPFQAIRVKLQGVELINPSEKFDPEHVFQHTWTDDNLWLRLYAEKLSGTAGLLYTVRIYVPPEAPLSSDSAESKKMLSLGKLLVNGRAALYVDGEETCAQEIEVAPELEESARDEDKEEESLTGQLENLNLGDVADGEEETADDVDEGAEDDAKFINALLGLNITQENYRSKLKSLTGPAERIDDLKSAIEAAEKEEMGDIACVPPAVAHLQFEPSVGTNSEEPCPYDPDDENLWNKEDADSDGDEADDVGDAIADEMDLPDCDD